MIDMQLRPRTMQAELDDRVVPELAAAGTIRDS